MRSEIPTKAPNKGRQISLYQNRYVSKNSVIVLVAKRMSSLGMLG